MSERRTLQKDIKIEAGGEISVCMSVSERERERDRERETERERKKERGPLCLDMLKAPFLPEQSPHDRCANRTWKQQPFSLELLC